MFFFHSLLMLDHAYLKHPKKPSKMKSFISISLALLFLMKLAIRFNLNIKISSFPILFSPHFPREIFMHS